MSAPRIDRTPAEMIAHFRELHAAGEITAREKEIALKRWAQTQRAWIVRRGVKHTWTTEAIGCNCGKGILCPAVWYEPENLTLYAW